jgi:hypothetical protein
MREDYSENPYHSYAGIAKKYGVSVRTAYDIVNCVTWQHVPMPMHMKFRRRPASFGVRRSLTTEQAQELRSKFEAGRSAASLAAEYNIHVRTAWRYANMLEWKSGNEQP